MAIAVASEKPVSDAPAGKRLPIHINFLDGMRGLAALYVTIYHAASNATLGVTDERSWVLQPMVLFAFGRSAVDVFIVLSGFCLMLPISRAGADTFQRGMGNFFTRRARRILPPYYVALAFSLALLWLFPSMRTQWKGINAPYDGNTFGWDVAAHLLLVHNLWKQIAFRINDPMWSVATEWQIYFAFALVLLPARRWFGLVGPIVLGVLLGWASQYGPLFSARFWFLGSFALGMAAADLALAPKWRGKLDPALLWRVSVGLGTAAILVIVAYSERGWIYDLPLPDTLLALAVASFLLFGTALGQREDYDGTGAAVVRFLGSKGPAGLGRFSYSLYLVHFPLFLLMTGFLIKRGLDQAAVLGVLIFAGLPATLGLSYLFHLAFERPFLNTPTPAGKDA